MDIVTIVATVVSAVVGVVGLVWKFYSHHRPGRHAATESGPTLSADSLSGRPVDSTPVLQPDDGQDGGCASRVLHYRNLDVDAVSVRLAVDAFHEDHNSTFEVAWPSATGKYIEQLKNLRAVAERYREPGTTFYGEQDDVINYFMERADHALDEVERIMWGVPKRVGPLLAGMEAHWGTMDFLKERALGRFLKLSHINLIYGVVSCFRFTILYGTYFPSEYDSWFRSPLAHIEQEFLEVEEPILYACVYQLCGVRVERTFLGPRGVVMEAYRDYDNGDKIIANNWFVKYLIPQNELELACSESTDIFQYDERAGIRKVVDSAGNEVSAYSPVAR